MTAPSYNGDVQTGGDSGSSGTITSITLDASVEAAVAEFGGYNISSTNLSNASIQLGGNDPDVTLKARNSYGDAQWISTWVSPPTGSSIDLTYSGLNSGDFLHGAVYGLLNVDTDELAATGYPDTDTDIHNGSGSLSLSMSATTNALALDGGLFYDTNTTETGRAASGSGQTEIYELTSGTPDREFGSYKAGSTTVSMSYSLSTGFRYGVYLGVIVPGSEGAPVDVVLPAAASFVLAGSAAVIAAGASTAAPDGTFAVSGQLPAVAISAAVTVPADGFSIAGNIPGRAAGASTASPAQSILLEELAPGVAAGARVLGPAGSFAFAGETPAIGTGASTATPSQPLTLNTFVPAVSASAVIASPAGTFVVIAKSPFLGDTLGFEIPAHAFGLAGFPVGIVAATEPRMYRAPSGMFWMRVM